MWAYILYRDGRREFCRRWHSLLHGAFPNRARRRRNLWSACREFLRPRGQKFRRFCSASSLRLPPRTRTWDSRNTTKGRRRCASLFPEGRAALRLRPKFRQFRPDRARGSRRSPICGRQSFRMRRSSRPPPCLSEWAICPFYPSRQSKCRGRSTAGWTRCRLSNPERSVCPRHRNL